MCSFVCDTKSRGKFSKHWSVMQSGDFLSDMVPLKY